MWRSWDLAADLCLSHLAKVFVVIVVGGGVVVVVGVGFVVRDLVAGLCLIFLRFGGGVGFLVAVFRWW